MSNASTNHSPPRVSAVCRRALEKEHTTGKRQIEWLHPGGGGGDQAVSAAQSENLERIQAAGRGKLSAAKEKALLAVAANNDDGVGGGMEREENDGAKGNMKEKKGKGQPLAKQERRSVDLTKYVSSTAAAAARKKGHLAGVEALGAPPPPPDSSTAGVVVKEEEEEEVAGQDNCNTTTTVPTASTGSMSSECSTMLQREIARQSGLHFAKRTWSDSMAVVTTAVTSASAPAAYSFHPRAEELQAALSLKRLALDVSKQVFSVTPPPLRFLEVQLHCANQAREVRQLTDLLLVAITRQEQGELLTRTTDPTTAHRHQASSSSSSSFTSCSIRSCVSSVVSLFHSLHTHITHTAAERNRLIDTSGSGGGGGGLPSLDDINEANQRNEGTVVGLLAATDRIVDSFSVKPSSPSNTS